jgi:enediyne biosynthesis thioesterase
MTKLADEQHRERSGEDRRKLPTDFNRRNFDRRTKTFLYERTIHLSDTNTFGNVYFAYFFIFQGECREEFFQFLLGADIIPFMQSGYNILTINAHTDYKAALYNGDKIQIQLRVTEVKRTRVKLEFTIVNKANEETAAIGYQWICFADPNRKPIPIPEIFVKHAKRLSIL